MGPLRRHHHGAPSTPTHITLCIVLPKVLRWPRMVLLLLRYCTMETPMRIHELTLVGISTWIRIRLLLPRM